LAALRVSSRRAALCARSLVQLVALFRQQITPARNPSDKQLIHLGWQQRGDGAESLDLLLNLA